MAETTEMRQRKPRAAMASDGVWLQVPPAIRHRVHQFMLDLRSGNVVLHVRDGEILKATLEEHVKG